MRQESRTDSSPPLALIVVLAALAGGMGWGIRGQYGHQTGAMMAGLLVSLVIVLLLGGNTSSLHVVRAAGMGAIGIGFGGSMTYGQTIGLTQDVELRGNWSALSWGMIGLAVKGGVWVGFCGALLGMGLSRLRYRTGELALLFLTLIGFLFLGLFLLNSPFDPANRQLPALYFSATWEWFPLKEDPKPRYENWGGLLAALIALIVYLGAGKKDRVARNLALWGLLSGAIGFPAGQSLQAYHAWNEAAFVDGPLAPFGFITNWWNVMEITFGMVLGGGLGLGAWLHRGALGEWEGEDAVEVTPRVEALCVGLHGATLIAWEFLDFGPVERWADMALPVWILPLLAVVGGRRFRYAFVLPVVALPIAGKTLRELSYKPESLLIPAVVGWPVFVVLPLIVMSVVAWYSYRRAEDGEPGRTFAARALVCSAWLYYGLNYAFFRFPWPWQPPTGRTPSAVLFTICVLALTGAAWPHLFPPSSRRR